MVETGWRAALQRAPAEVQEEVERCEGCETAELLTWAIWRVREQLRGKWVEEAVSGEPLRRQMERVKRLVRRRGEVMREWRERRGGDRVTG